MKKLFLWFFISYFSSPSFALSVKLPVVKEEFKKSSLPGYNLAVQKCLICHSADYVQYQPPSIDRKGWEAEVKKMQQSFKAPLNDGEIPLIAEYITKLYGNEQADYKSQNQKSKLTASTALEQTPLSSTTDKLKKPLQLKDNNCLTCHAVDAAVVGPAFKDIAAKYKKNPNALKNVMTKIKNGGSGDWGEMEMPPQPQIKDSDLKIISQWILKQ